MSERTIDVPKKDGDFKPSATLKLTEKEGNFISGLLKKRFESNTYPGKYSYLIQVQDLEGHTVVWNKEKKVEEELMVRVGDSIFVKGTTRLDLQLKQVPDNSLVKITYEGKGKAKKGQKPPFNFAVVVSE